MRIVVVAPPYTPRSAGISLLYRLAASLQAAGVDAGVLPFLNGKRVDSPANPFGADLNVVVDPDTDVVIYPEIYHDNPLGARRVVRYLLNRDGALTGGRKVGRENGEMVVRYSRLFGPADYDLFHPAIETRLFRPAADKYGVLSYSGKAGVHFFGGAYSGPVTCISRDWPADRMHYSHLLAGAIYLFSADPFTAVLHEALLAGCYPIITHWGDWSQSQLMTFEMPEVYWLNISEEWSPETVEKARMSLADRIAAYEAAWPAAVAGLVERIKDRWSFA